MNHEIVVKVMMYVQQNNEVIVGNGSTYSWFLIFNACNSTVWHTDHCAITANNFSVLTSLGYSLYFVKCLITFVSWMILTS